MRVLPLAVLLLASTAALAQAPAPPPPIAPDIETVYSDAELERDRSLSRAQVETVMEPAEALEYQYARWKRPVCFNVYGLAAGAKYVVERRMKDIAQKAGAPLDRRDPCIPNVTIAFTPDVRATLESVASRANYLLPYYGYIRSRLKESQPVQAWYVTSTRAPNGRAYLDYDGLNGGMNDALTPPRFGMLAGEMSRLNSGYTTAIESVLIVVDVNAIMGRSLGTLADHFAMLALAQARVTRGCKEVPTIANLMKPDCDPAYQADAITNLDLAMLTGLYHTPDDSMQRVQKARVIGTMRKTLEAQASGK